MTVDPAEIASLKARADLKSLMVQDGHSFRQVGARQQTNCPIHQDGDPSCYLLEGRFRCFSCGANGDAIHYLMERRKLTFTQALDVLRGGPVLAQPHKIDKRRKHEPIMPVPERAPATRFHHGKFGEPKRVWHYRSPAGATLLVDARYEYEEKGKAKKAVITWCWARDEEGTQGWTMTRPSRLTPLYGQDRLLAASTVVLVEGCKTADALQAALADPTIAAMTWCGGCKNTVHADAHDLMPLKGKNVILWPDHDKVGAQAMRELHQHLTAIGAQVIGVVDLRGRELPEGWDAADALDAATVRSCFAQQVTANIPNALTAMLATFPGEIAKGATKAVAVEPPPPDEPELPATDEPGEGPEDPEKADIYNASRFVAMHIDIARYCAVMERWNIWDGKCWKGDLDGAVMRLAELTAKAIAQDFMAEAAQCHQQADEMDLTQPGAHKEVETLRRRASRLGAKAEQIQSEVKLNAMIALAKTRKSIIVDPKDLDKAEYLFNCNNGVVDLRDGRLYQHDPKYFCTRLAPVDYEPETDRTRLMTVVSHVCNDDEQVMAFAQAILGRSLFGNNALEQFYVWAGPGRSGKGTLLEAVKAAMGDYCMTAEFQSFIRTPGHRVRDDLARLAEARLVLASEVEKGEEMAAAIIKTLTGQDTITARQLYGSYFEFRPRLTLHLQCNDLPRVDDRDVAIWERMVIVPCGPLIPKEKRDPTFKTYLFDPAAGGKAVLSWLIEGAVKHHAAKRLEEPAVVTAASTAYRTSQDPVKDFFAESLRFAAGDNQARTFCIVREMVGAYHAFCDAMFLPPKYRISPRALGERLEARGCWRHKRRAGKANTPESCWIGVTIKNQEQLAWGESFMPGDEEHETTLGSVPVFLRSAPQQTPIRARARPGMREDFNKLEEQRNTGTDQQVIEGANQPPTTDPEEPGPSSGLDLADLP